MKKTLKALGAAVALGLLTAAPVRGAEFILVNIDPPGSGFNDPTPATPVGGNVGTTVGDQRVIAYSRALQLWGSVLRSNVPIVVLGGFQPRDCTPTSGVLASAGAWTIESDFANAPLPRHWYHSALANSIAGTDLYPGADIVDGADLLALFNSELGTPDCLTTSRWYYGLDSMADPAAGDIDFLNVSMHEIAHGLGFSNFASETNGSTPLGMPDVYMASTRDNVSGKMWDQMTPTEIVAAAVRSGQQVWTGPNVTARAPAVLDPQTMLRLSAPPALAGDYEFGTAAAIGPPATPANFNGPIAVGSPLDACAPLTNGAAVAGKIALVRRGSCAFTVKAKNAQNAGAAGVIIGNNASGGSAFGIGGADPTVTVPVISVATALGDALIAAGGGAGALVVSATQLAGADASGHVRLYAPSPVEPGSSISHFDVVAQPSLLMEPAITPALEASNNVDLTAALFMDLGWQTEFTIANCGKGSGAEGVDTEGHIYAAPVFYCAIDAKNHGQFQSCSTKYLNQLVRFGVIGGAVKGMMNSSCVAKAK